MTMKRPALAFSALTLALLLLCPTHAHAIFGFGEPDSQEYFYASPFGFIRESLPVDAVISQVTGDNQTTGNKRMLGSRDILYMDLASPEEVSPGDLFTMYRRIHKVYHPANGGYLGDLISVLGVVKIKQVYDYVAAIQVVKSYLPISSGDAAMRYVPPPPKQDPVPGRSLPDSHGVIVEFPPQQTLIAQGHVVYIDWGREDGLQVGDRLKTFRVGSGLPIRTIGELQVVDVQDQTASARIVGSIAPLALGDLFTFQEATNRTVASVPGQDIERLAEQFETLDTPEFLEDTETANIDVQVDGDETRVSVHLDGLMERVRFDEGKADIKPAGQKILKQIAEILKEENNRLIRIAGHADSKPIGPSLKIYFPDNKALSEARAKSVAQFLIQESGMESDKLTTVGFGDRKPVASNATDSGREANRRVEIVLYSSTSSEPPAPGFESGDMSQESTPTELGFPTGDEMFLGVPSPLEEGSSAPSGSKPGTSMGDPQAEEPHGAVSSVGELTSSAAESFLEPVSPSGAQELGEEPSPIVEPFSIPAANESVTPPGSAELEDLVQPESPVSLPTPAN